MNNDLMSINHSLGKQIELLEKQLSIAIVGLEAIISEGSDIKARFQKLANIL